MSNSSDRNLLFGLLAMQMGFIDRDDLVEALQSWVTDKSAPLGELLVGRGCFDREVQALLDSLLEKQIDRQGGQLHLRLASIGHATSAVDDLHRDLQSTVDADLQSSIAALGVSETLPFVPAAEKNTPVLEVLTKPEMAADDGSEFGTVHHASTDIDAIDIADSAVVRKRIGDKTVVLFGDYQLHEELGRGGMGVVYRATQRSLKRVVALKMIKSGELSSKIEVDRFRAEAEAAAKLDHPNIVPVYEIGELNSQHYFSMGYVDGQSLSALVKDGPLAQTEAARFVEQAARAVQHAHDRGVVHRDLKPANILLQRADSKSSSPSWTLKVADFGLAKQMNAGEGKTHTGDVLGTPGYMSPEQALGHKQVGPAADIYSLGAVLYHLVVGRPPFQAASPVETLRQVIDVEPVSVRSLNPAVSRDLETICQKCLHKEQSRRYLSAAALADDLDRTLRGEPIEARPVGAFERTLRWAKRRPAIASLSAAVVAAIAAGVAGTSVYAMRANDLAERASDEAQRATIQARLANENEGAARRSETNAKTSESQAMAAKGESEARLYNSDMLLVQSAWESNNFRLMKELLDRYDCKYEPSKDPRGFEWHYWHTRLCDDLLTMQGHAGDVSSVCFSPDGTCIASASEDQTVKLWDTRTGRLQTTMTGHSGRVTSVVFSLDGMRLASGSDDKTVKLWDTRTGQLQTTLVGHSGAVTSVVFSPNGWRLASGSNDGTVKLWDARMGQLQTTLVGHSGAVTSVVFSPDGVSVVSGSEDRTMKLWNARMGQLQTTLEGHSFGVDSVCFNPDGTRLASGSYDKTVKLWDARTGRLQTTLAGHSHSVKSVRFSPDGTRLASGSYDKTVKLWDARTGRLQTTFAGHSDLVNCVCFSPDGTRLASGSYDQAVKLWGVCTGHLQTTLLGHLRQVDSVVFSPDGTRLATGSIDNTVKLWNARSGQLQTTLAVSRGLANVAFSPDGTRLASGSFDHTVKLWDVRTGHLQTTLVGHLRQVGSVVFSPDGTCIASASEDQTVKLWDTRTGQLQTTLVGHSGAITSVVFSHDGRRLASGSNDGTVKLWDARMGQLQTTLMDSRGVSSVAFSPDGTRLASGSYDHAVKLWDARMGQLQTTLVGHSGAITSVVFSHDGRRLASGSNDGTVKLWDARMGQLQTTLMDSRGVSSVAFSPDGACLASGSYDHTVKLWDARRDARSRSDERVRRIVVSLFELPLTRAEVNDRLENKALLPVDLQMQAISLARSMPDDWRRLAKASSNYSLFDTATPAVRRRAAELALKACELSKNSDAALTALAAAQFRLGDYPRALDTMKSRIAPDNNPETICLEAMEWKAMGRDDVAAARLAEASRLGVRLPEQAKRGFDRIFDEANKAVLGTGRLAHIEKLNATVRAMFDEQPLKSDIRVQFENNAGWSVEDRRIALAVLEILPEPSANELNRKSWDIASRANQTTAEYEQAVRFAEVGIAKAPKDWALLNTLGVARYRAGQFDKAFATLAKSEKLNARGGVSHPTDLAFLAMTQYKLGKTAEANATLERCRLSAIRSEFAHDADAKKFLAEAEALTAGERPR